MDKELREKIEQIGQSLQKGKAKVEECRAMIDLLLHDASTCFDKAAGEFIGLLAEEVAKKPFDTKEIESLNYRPKDKCGCG